MLGVTTAVHCMLFVLGRLDWLICLEPNGSHSRQFVAMSVYQATQARHLAVQLYHEHTNKPTNKREEDSLGKKEDSIRQ